jgi:aminopeptidase N
MVRRPRPIRLAGVAAVAVLAAGAAACASRSDDDALGRDQPGETPTTEPAAVDPVAGATGVGDQYFPDAGGGGYDVEHYDIDLTWHPDTGRVDAETTVTARATEALSSLALDLVGLDVTAATVDGEPATVARSGERDLVLAPAEPLPAGEEFTATVTYGGPPGSLPEVDPIAPGWFADAEGEVYTAFEPTGAATLFPANDHPSDKAAYTFRVTVPDGTEVVANGLHRETVPGDGMATWVYEMTDPMASYLVQVAIGDFDIVESTGPGGLPIRHAIDSDVGLDDMATLDRTAEMIDVLDDMFGPFPFATYGGLVIDQQINYALETQTLTLFGPFSAGDETTVVHELAHQWFGDDVSPALWKDVWLNEGFATYAEWLWSERTGSDDADTIAHRVDESGGSDLDLPPADPGPNDLFAASVYERGALTLHVLRRTIGDDAFFTVLRTWVERFGGKSPSTADFEALAEEISGQELTPMFDAWLRAPTAPRLDDWVG